MVTLNDIKTLIKEETEKLLTIGYCPMEIKEVQLVKATSFYADAWRTQSKIRVSQYFLSAPIEEIRATIMHELIHMVPEAGHGHGYDWKVIANAVNRAYPQYNIKRTGSQVAGSQRSFNLSQSAGKNTPIAQHLIKCECCGSEFRRTRESNLTLHPERYKCRCGGRLVRVF